VTVDERRGRAATAAGRRGLFVTGTDTGVGKTLVAAALARVARRRGLAPIPFKPVETGCDPDPLDAMALARAADAGLALSEICPYRLHLPAAPALAARAEGVQIDVDDVVARAERLGDRGFLIAEGAGGLLVPYAEGVTAADLAARLRLPLLVVARTALGTINHTALTVREARRAGLALAAVVLNKTTAAADPHEEANAELIAELTGLLPLGPLPFLVPEVRTDPDRLADALADALAPADLDRLLGVAA
jgi:dethiobiotin synthetase